MCVIFITENRLMCVETCEGVSIIVKNNATGGRGNDNTSDPQKQQGDTANATIIADNVTSPTLNMPCNNKVLNEFLNGK